MLLAVLQPLFGAAAHFVPAGTLYLSIAELMFAGFFVWLRILSVAVAMPVTKRFWGVCGEPRSDRISAFMALRKDSLGPVGVDFNQKTGKDGQIRH
jgi:cell division protein FtsW (lipid II flippase)